MLYRRSGLHGREATRTEENSRQDGFVLFLLGSAVFILMSIALEIYSPVAMTDFNGPYYGTRCFLEHRDPYKTSDMILTYKADNNNNSFQIFAGGRTAVELGYLPTIFPVTAPIAFLAFGPAHLVWFALILCGLIVASFLMWNVSATHAPVVSGCLLGFMLANSELVAVIGNPAGIAISCCVVATWCFVEGKYVPAGIVCLSIGLMIKPHDVGLVWLYFLLAGGIYRKRAVQTLVIAIVASLPALIWITSLAPDWLSELHGMLQSLAAHGAMNDPGPASSGAHQLGMMVNLQTVISVFRDSPPFYNSVSYAIAFALLIVLSLTALRSKPSPCQAWAALASIAALTMLPIYHRQTDTKLLLLTIPACAKLCEEGGLLGRAAMLITASGFVLTGDFPWVIVLRVISHTHASTSSILGGVIVGIQIFPVPLILLITATFYLWIFLRCVTTERSQDCGERPMATSRTSASN